MLVITRCVGERFFIDENITVTVLSSKGRQIRVGIKAPKKVSIVREELIRTKGKEKRHRVTQSSDEDKA